MVVDDRLDDPVRDGERRGRRRSRSRSSAITGQWASTVPVDADGTPVAPCIMWTDTRGRRHTSVRFGGPVGGYSPAALARWIRRTGGVPSPNGKGPTGQQLYLNHDRPDIAAAARWYLEPVDYLAMRFTGRRVGHPCVDDRGVAHRQPPPRRARL